MEQNTTASADQTDSQATAQDLVRPVEGRIVAGVAQGLANRYDLPVWVPRLVFILTSFAGGVGLALYLAGWGLMRSEDETEPIAERFFSGASTSKAWVGIGLIFIAALILLDNLTFLSGGVIWAVALLVVGVLLYTGQIPLSKSQSDEETSKEGVQPVTPTETRTPLPGSAAIAGDSPSGGTTPPTPPTPPTPTPPVLPPRAAKPKEKSILGRLTIGIMLLGVGILAVFDNIPDFPVYPEPRHYLALAVTILGLGLLVGAFAGRARWLILVGVVLVPTLMFSPVFEYDWSTESFSLVTEPATFAEIEDSYSIDIGEMVIDLTDLPWDGETVAIDASIDVGDLRIRIPRGVGIVGEASVNIGNVESAGRQSSGIGQPSLTFNDSDQELGTVLLDAHVDVGSVNIVSR